MYVCDEETQNEYHIILVKMIYFVQNSLDFLEGPSLLFHTYTIEPSDTIRERKIQSQCGNLHSSIIEIKCWIGLKDLPLQMQPQAGCKTQDRKCQWLFIHSQKRSIH